MTRPNSNQVCMLRQAAEAHGDWLESDELEFNTATSLARRKLLIPKDGESPGLVITAAGYEVIGTASTPQAPAPLDASEPVAPAGQACGKLEQVERLLRRGGGASLEEEFQAATDWKAHSIRGALSDALKKQRQPTVTSQKLDHRRAYLISGAEVAA